MWLARDVAGGGNHDHGPALPGAAARTIFTDRKSRAVRATTVSAGA
jgi:hypothetical protein